MEVLIFVALYTLWALYSGKKYIDGKYESLEQNTTASKVKKVLAILAVGYVIGTFTFCWQLIKIAIRITDGFR